MEEDCPSKPSVAELAGRFKGHILPMPASNDERPFRRRPPCSLKLLPQKDDNEDSPKTISPSNPVKVRTKNSALIEKLQANLALSPTALLPSPKSPDVKLQPAPLSPTTTTPQSPLTPMSPSLRPLSPHSPSLKPTQQSTEEETRWDSTRRLRGTHCPTSTRLEPACPSSAALPPDNTGDQPAKNPHLQSHSAGRDPEKDRDCDTIEEEVSRSNPEEDTSRSEEKMSEGSGEEEQQQQKTSETSVAKGNEEEMEVSEDVDQNENEGM
ncbi:hypothetical protein WMY93_029101 [Mugilogobius chulae]|uniref:FAM21/CAPZIP domain-containing protein n=1 Tax=Mugilogobius chulae TaxID=88201 RepID=A0AAW0MUV9_9GOBI